MTDEFIINHSNEILTVISKFFNVRIIIEIISRSRIDKKDKLKFTPVYNKNINLDENIPTIHIIETKKN